MNFHKNKIQVEKFMKSKILLLMIYIKNKPSRCCYYYYEQSLQENKKFNPKLSK